MPEAECVVCRHVITHPICGGCLGEEVEVWLQETQPEIIQEMKDKAEEMTVPHGNTNCIVCHEKMDVCSYCFTTHILDWLFEYPDLIPEFVKFFNFDLNFDGYARELLEMV